MHFRIRCRNGWTIAIQGEETRSASLPSWGPNCQELGAPVQRRDRSPLASGLPGLPQRFDAPDPNLRHGGGAQSPPSAVRDCHSALARAFEALKEICPDKTTLESMEMTARLGGMTPCRLAKVPDEFLPLEPTETHATVSKGAHDVERGPNECTGRTARKVSPNGKTEPARHASSL